MVAMDEDIAIQNMALALNLCAKMAHIVCGPEDENGNTWIDEDNVHAKEAVIDKGVIFWPN